jgi:hypothetical protein
MASIFLDAKIYTFEPLPENFEILKKISKNMTTLRL